MKCEIRSRRRGARRPFRELNDKEEKMSDRVIVRCDCRTKRTFSRASVV